MKKSSFWCDHCQQDVEWLPVNDVCEVTGVTRRTVYNWMNRAWVHTRRLPSGWRVVCKKSLTGRARNAPHEVRPEA